MSEPTPVRGSWLRAGAENPELFTCDAPDVLALARAVNARLNGLGCPDLSAASRAFLAQQLSQSWSSGSPGLPQLVVARHRSGHAELEPDSRWGGGTIDPAAIIGTLELSFVERIGLFAPDSILRRIHRERVVGLWALLRAVLLQATDPRAFTIFDLHSGPPEHLFRRLASTAQAFERMFFGPADVAEETASGVRARHAAASGEFPKSAPAGLTGAYRADEPELLLRVLALLADSAVLTYETFVGPLTPAQREAAWQDYLRFGELFGLSPNDAPETWEHCRAYVRGTLATAELVPGARAEGRRVLLELPVATWDVPMRSVARLAVVGLLDPYVRELYGFSWGWPDQAQFLALVAGVKAGRRIGPESLWTGSCDFAYDKVSNEEARRHGRRGSEPTRRAAVAGDVESEIRQALDGAAALIDRSLAVPMPDVVQVEDGEVILTYPSAGLFESDRRFIAGAVSERLGDRPVEVRVGESLMREQIATMDVVLDILGDDPLASMLFRVGLHWAAGEQVLVVTVWFSGDVPFPDALRARLRSLLATRLPGTLEALAAQSDLRVELRRVDPSPDAQERLHWSELVLAVTDPDELEYALRIVRHDAGDQATEQLLSERTPPE